MISWCCGKLNCKYGKPNCKCGKPNCKAPQEIGLTCRACGKFTCRWLAGSGKSDKYLARHRQETLHFADGLAIHDGG